jgi:methionine synthase II (cobalamin-independent)
VFYAHEEDAAMDYAAAVNAEIRDLFDAGADYVQIDEPYLQARPQKARQYGLRAAACACRTGGDSARLRHEAFAAGDGIRQDAGDGTGCRHLAR